MKARKATMTVTIGSRRRIPARIHLLLVPHPERYRLHLRFPSAGQSSLPLKVGQRTPWNQIHGEPTVLEEWRVKIPSTMSSLTPYWAATA